MVTNSRRCLGPLVVVPGEGDRGERQAGHDLEESADQRSVDVQQP
jgi:hypothetical protein